MPVKSRENLYPGVNPHLNSFLQHEQGWKGFHTLFLSQMGQFIEDRLPPGYLTSTEESLVKNTTRKQPVSIVIYNVDKPVTRIELLSPANKAPGSHADSYQKKRQ